MKYELEKILNRFYSILNSISNALKFVINICSLIGWYIDFPILSLIRMIGCSVLSGCNEK